MKSVELSCIPLKPLRLYDLKLLILRAGTVGLHSFEAAKAVRLADVDGVEDGDPCIPLKPLRLYDPWRVGLGAASACIPLKPLRLYDVHASGCHMALLPAFL